MDRSYGAVVYRKDGRGVSFLLVHHTRHDTWDIPKGHPEEGESPEEAARREVLEETGYRIELVPGFRESIEYVLPRGEDKIVVFFLGKGCGGKTGVIDEDEIDRTEWLGREEAAGRMTYDNSRDVLRKAADFLDERSGLVTS